MGLIAPYTVLLFTLSLFSASLAFTPAFDYNSTKVRGVNLGGWLVLEPWITPSIFDNTHDDRIIDEYTFGLYQNRTTAMNTLQTHWESWINETDFKEIAEAGLNHVRIPIGYWAFDTSAGEPYLPGQALYLEKAITWAETHKLKVIINLHGVPGSQNGLDNSGQTTSDPSWYHSQSNIDRTRAIIKQLAYTYMNSTVVTAISVMNEPFPDRTQDPSVMLDLTTHYYYDSYGDIRYPLGTTQESSTVLIVSDAFKGLDYWKNLNFMPPSDFQGVMMDIHKYQMFTNDDIRKTNDEHISAACSQGQELANSTLWAIVGEWTPAATDCAKHLNGRFVGSRYEGTDVAVNASLVGSCVGLTGSAATFNESYRQFLGQYWEAQASTYEQSGAGWIQWTWKTESADEWSYQAGLKYEWIKKISFDTFGFPLYPTNAICARRSRSSPSAPGRSHSISSFSGTYSYTALIFQVIAVFCIHVFLW